MRFYNTKEREKEIATSDNKGGLRMISIGGTEKVTKNMTVYEYHDEIIIVDCGVGFPDIFDMPGVDVLIPDFTYLLQNAHKIKGLFITHGHEDHVGAVPNLLLELPDIPIYASKLVGEFLKVKLDEKSFKQAKNNFHFHLMDPTTGEVNLGNFKISAFRLNHSIPETMGFAIRTPEGLIVHISDFKFDATPVLDKPADLATIERLGKEGILCLISDCLGVTAEGHTKSEATLSQTFFDLFGRAGKRQVLVTTMSSNISRMYQIMSAAQKFDRKIVPSGRSIEQMVDVARRLGYLPFPDDFFVDEEECQKYQQSELLYLIAGCYGQPESSLGRLSRGEHESISLEEDAMVVFSGDPNPPGADIMVEKLMDALTLKGAELVYSDIQENLHVSGHALRDDIEKLVKLSNAQYYIPVGGSITKMRAYTNALRRDLGISKDRVFENLEGDSVIFKGYRAKRGPHVDVKPVFMGSNKTEELSPVVVQDRTQLSEDGVFVVAVPITSKGQPLADKTEIITRGFIYVKDSRELMEKSKRLVRKKLAKLASEKKEMGEMKKKLENEMIGFLRKETSMSPMVIVHFITI